MKVFDLFGQISLKGIDGVNKQLGGLQGNLNSMGAKMTSVGKGMTVAGGAMVGAVTAIAAPSIKMASDFDTAMRSVNTMLLLNEEEFQKLSADTREMAKAMGVEAPEAAQALYQAISAGVPKDDVISFMEIATKAAIGGMTDTETAVDGLTTVINAFKLPMSSAQEVADLMFTTVKGGKTTMEELSASMFQVAPIAAASGVQFAEVSAALSTMTKQGVPTAQATTQLRQAMVALQKPSADMAKVIEGLGYESGQAMLEELGFAKTLETLRAATGGSNEMLMKMFGSVEAGSAVLALTGENAQMFATDLAAMENASGASQDAFDEMEKSTSRQMAHLMSDLKDIAITIGNALIPVLKDIMATVTPIIQKVGAWIKENPKLTKTILIVVGAIGGLLLVFGPILMMLGMLLPLLPAIGAAFAALMGPIGLIILGVIALIAIGVLLWKHWDEIKAKAIEIWNGIADFFSGAWEKAKEWGSNIVKGLWDGIKSMATWIWNKVAGFAKGIWENIKSGLGSLWANSPSEAGISIGTGLTEGIELGVKKAIGKVSSAMQDIGAEMAVNVGGVSPRLSAVAPISSGSSVSNEFNIAQLIVREEADVPKIARELYRMQQSKVRALGG
jgi:TP901 family phage tail tape measure protein